MKIAILLSFILIACSKGNISEDSQKRVSIQKIETFEVPEFQGGFLAASTKIYESVSHPEFDSKKCVEYLSLLEKQIDTIDVTTFKSTNIDTEAEAIIETSWKIRSKLHSLLPTFSEACVMQVQAIFRQFRFIEDYLGERARKATWLTPDKINFQAQPTPILDQGPSFYIFQKNSEIKTSEFKEGDLLISRGLSFLSAMIARLGVRGTQFSHVVFVTKDPRDNLIKTMESYVGVGVDFYQMDYALKNENARILWLRSRDQVVAQKASELMSKKLIDIFDRKERIHYDYDLDFNDHESMSCAEVSQVAYELGSDGQIKIPYYLNEIKGAQSLLDHIGLKPGPTYEPGDMEIDPRFELVGEFRDLRLTRDSRHKDAILSEIFRWMDQEGYVLHDSLKSKMAGGIIYRARRTVMWPLVKFALGLDDFSKEIPPKMLKTVELLREIGGIMLEEVQKRDEAFEAKHGWPMTYIELYKTLEEFRKKDLELYNNKHTRKKSKLHRLIRPK